MERRSQDQGAGDSLPRGDCQVMQADAGGKYLLGAMARVCWGP